MSWIAATLIVLAALVGMELFAWVAHRYIMHGWGWGWHRDHHEPHSNRFERNDLFAVVFGSINIALYLVGTLYWEWVFWMALGINLYGLVYAFVHDGLVHQRFGRIPVKGRYARRLVQAHRLHHATRGKEGGVSFGFVFARDPVKLKAELREQVAAGKAVLQNNAGQKSQEV